MTIEVRMTGRGAVRDGEASMEPGTQARCDLCAKDVDMVVSVSADASSFACKDCLRGRLEATTVAQWLLRNPGDRGLPWGKFSG